VIRKFNGQNDLEDTTRAPSAYVAAAAVAATDGGAAFAAAVDGATAAKVARRPAAN